MLPSAFAHIRRIEADQRVSAPLGSVLGLYLNLLNRLLLCRLYFATGGGSERSICVLPLIARWDRRENLPMLYDFAIREAEEVVIRGGLRIGVSFNQREHEIAFRYVAAWNKGRHGPAFRDLSKA